MYIDQLLRKYNMSECKHMKTAQESKLDLPVKDEELDVPYQQVIDSLLRGYWDMYVPGTRGYSLQFWKGNLDIQGFVDFDWESKSWDRWSYTGYVFKLNDSVILFESVKEKTVALSSMEAEYMALSKAPKEAI